jgi:chromosome segregation ATPase
MSLRFSAACNCWLLVLCLLSLSLCSSLCSASSLFATPTGQLTSQSIVASNALLVKDVDVYSALRQLSARIDELQQQPSNPEATSSDELKAIIDLQAASLAQLNATLTSQLFGVSAEAASSAAEVLALKSESLQAKSDVAALSSRLLTAEGTITLLQQNTDEVTSRLTSVESQLSQAEARIGALESNCTCISQVAVNPSSNGQSADARVDALTARLDALEQMTPDSSPLVSAVLTNINALLIAEANHSAVLATLSGQAVTLSQQVNIITQQASTLAQQQSSLSILSSTQHQDEVTISALQASASACSNDILSVTDRVSAVQWNCSTGLSALQSQLGATDLRASTLTTRVTAIEQLTPPTSSLLVSTVLAQSGSIIQLITNSSNQASTLAQHTALFQTINSVNSSNLAGTVAALSVTQQQHTSQIYALQTSDFTQAASLTSLSSNTASLSSRVAVTESNLTSLTTRITALESASSSLTSSISLSIIQSNLTSISTRVTAVEASETNAAVRLSAAEANLTSLKTRVGALEATSVATQVEVTALQLANASTSVRVTVVESSAAALSARMSVVETAASSIRTLASQLDLLNSTQQSQALNFVNLSVLVSAIESASSSLTARMSAAESLSGGTQLSLTAALHSSQIAALQQANISEQAGAAAVRARLSTAESTLTDVSVRLAAAESLTTFSPPTPLVSAILAFNSSINQQSGQIRALQQANSTLSTGLNFVSNHVSAAETAASMLTGRVTAAESLLGVLVNTSRLHTDQIAALQRANQSSSSLVSGLSFSLSVIAQQQLSTNASLSISLSALAARISAVEQLSPVLPLSVLYSTLTDLRDSSGSSELVTDVRRLTGWISDLNRSVALSSQAVGCNSPTAFCNLCSSLSIKVVGQGQVILPPTGCWSAMSFVIGATMQLSATAALNWTLLAWSQNFSSTNLALSFVMPASSVYLTATFAFCYQLTTNVSAGGTSNVSTSPISSPGCALGRYTSGASVLVSAIPAANFFFSVWSGGSASNSMVLSFSMPASDASLTANFRACYLLTLSLVGSGNVSSTPSSSVGCSSGRYFAAVPVQVTATAAANVIFSAWSGGSASNASVLFFSMPSADTSLTANFLGCYLLTITVVTGGSTSTVSTTPLNSVGCTAGRYFSGATVQISASPSSNFAFTGWNGASTSNASVLFFRQPVSDAALQATFQECYLLTLSVEPGVFGGVGTAPLSSVGCASGRFIAGAIVTVTATPANAFSFWTGVLSSFFTSSVLYSMPANNATASVQFGVSCSLAIISTANLTINITRNIDFQMWGGE